MATIYITANNPFRYNYYILHVQVQFIF